MTDNGIGAWLRGVAYACARNRRRGNTKAAADSRAVVLCRDKSEAQRVSREHGASAASINMLDRIADSGRPVVVDLSTLEMVADVASTNIRALVDTIEKARREAEEQGRRIREMEDRIAYLEEALLQYEAR